MHLASRISHLASRISHLASRISHLASRIARSPIGVVASLTVLFLTAGCTSRELASTNVYDGKKVEDGPLGAGAIDITDTSVAGIRSKLEELFPGDRPLAQLDIAATGKATLTVPADPPWPATLSPSTLPQLISFPDNLASFLKPVDVPLGQIDGADKLFKLGNLSSTSTLTLHITMDPDDIVLGYMPVWHSGDPGSFVDTPGLWLPLEVQFPAGFGAGPSHCHCTGTTGSGAFADCNGLCSELSKNLPGGGTCEPFVTDELRRVPIAIGLVPLAQRPPKTGGAWTTNINITPGSAPGSPFTPGKNFHLYDMFDVVAIPGGAMTTYAAGAGKFDPAACDGKDLCILGGVEGCNAVADTICSFHDCNTDLANGVRDKVRSTLLEAFDGALQGPLEQFFEYTGQYFLPGPPSSQTSPPCSLGSSCDFDLVQTDLLPASVTYQKWDWFLGPFNQLGPSGSWHNPVTAVFPSPTGAKRYLPSLGITVSLAKINIEYSNDLDNDQWANSIDNCPEVYNPQQENTDGDSMGDACDPCPCSADEVTTTSDGLCGVCDPTLDLPGSHFCQDWCGQHAVDNCPEVTNPTQDNCNLQAELARGAQPRGDACDPVPCADTTSDSEALVATFGPAECRNTLPVSPALVGSCGALVDTAIRWHGVVEDKTASHSGLAQFAHCTCATAHATIDEQLKNCPCAFDSGAYFPTSYAKNSSGWGAITTTYGTQPLAIGRFQEPLHSYGTDYRLGASSEHAASWRFVRDLPEFGLVAPQQTDDYQLLKQNLEGIDEELQGIGWGYTPRYEQTSLTGAARDLASHFFVQDLDPIVTATISPPNAAMPACWLSPCLSHDVSPWLFVGDPGPVLFKTDRYQKPAPDGLLTRDVRTALSQVGTISSLVPASEPVARLRVQGESLRAALVDAQTGVLTAAVGYVNGTVFVGPRVLPRPDLATPVGAPASNPGSPTAEYASALSALRHELYTVTLSAAGDREELARLDLDAGTTDTREIRGLDAAGRPLALTYLVDPDVLYLLDEVPDKGRPRLRVVALGRNGWGRPIASLKRRGFYDRLYLGTSYDGNLVLSASPRWPAERPFFALLEPDSDGLHLKAWGFGDKPGALVAEPDTKNPVRWSYARRTRKGLITVSAVEPARLRECGGWPVEKGLAGVL